jgi:TP53 regulating kinase-like protein
MKIIARGAEAVLYKEDDHLVKERIKKGYRIKELDDSIRRTRTKKESKLISDSRRVGVLTPKIISTKEFKIEMEFIDGERLKELLNNTTDENRIKLSEEIGRSIGLLHKNGIIHGDLTTSNMIFKEKVYFIDFGLGEFSKKTEDQGIDLALFKEAVKSTHFKFLDQIWESFIKGYKETNNDWEQVLNTLEKIEKRGRYVKR